MLRRALVVLCLLPAPLQPVAAECHRWPLREVSQRVVYDGDTIYVNVPELPSPLRSISVRVVGIDTPEIRAKCDEERYSATAARDFLDHLLRQADDVSFCQPRWDKYGGRVLAEVRVDGLDVAELMVLNGFARPYDGGRRASWCRGD